MHIVVADCGQTMLEFICRPIRERGDRVHLFTDGLEALNYIKSDSTVDILITGLELSTISGLELCWETQVVMNSDSPVYIIVMSCSTDVAKLVEALDSGADDFLRKPFAPEELCARLRSAERVRGTQRDLMLLATTDPLTGVCNRRSFFKRSQAMLDKSNADELYAMIMLDIDHFKSVNDTYGHDVGDAVLRQVSGEIGSASMIFGRLGGEEFAAFLPGQSAMMAHKSAETMRNIIADMIIPAGDATISITCSFGISEWRDGEDIDAFLKRADQALYFAKTSGRNQTVIFGPECIAQNIHADDGVAAGDMPDFIPMEGASSAA